MKLTAALSALALLVALALVGCGGGGEESTTTGESTTAAAKPETSSPKPESQEPKDSAKTSQPTAQPIPQATNRTPGQKAPAPGVPITPEGDNSIQSFGAEGQTEQSEQATANLLTYLNARAAGEWAAACAATSAQLKSELATLIARAKGEEKPQGCAETLAALFGKTPEGVLQSAAQVGEVLSFRVKDDGYAYLIFKAPQDTVKFIAMADEDGTWKVNTLEPAAFQGSQGETR